MPSNDKSQTRRELLGVLLQLIADDPHPSTTLLRMAENMLEPDEVPIYARILMRKISGDQYPSIPMLRRVRALC
jgi:hypothetical protein